MVTANQVAAKARRRTRTVPVCLDGELLGEIDDLRDRLQQALRADQAAGESLASQAPGVLQQIREKEVEADEAVTEFKLRAIPGEDFDNLLRQYPPTEDDWARYKHEAEVAPLLTQPPEGNLAEILPRLLGLSVYEINGEPVEWTEDDGIVLWKDLHDGARAALGSEAWNVNSRSALRPTSGIGIDATPTSDPKSTSPANGASPSPSS